MSKRGEKFIKTCPQCGKQMEYMKSSRRKYCSRECANKSKHTGTDIRCDNCGKIFYRRQYHIDLQKKMGRNSFCCVQCQNEYLHKQSYETRICEICGQEFEISKLSTQRFCSDACQIKWQTTRVGILNPKFTSILTPCTYCGKEHYVKPYKFNEQNNFFCSTKCRRSWYAEVYSQRDEWKAESRQRILRELKNGCFNTETTPQKIVNELLNKLNIAYVREETFTYYAVDNYLPDVNLVIEVQGDYWHAHPLQFTSVLTEVQYKRINKDKAKHSYFKNQYNLEILYLWESDIKHNPELCIELIQLYIDSFGVLDNYHSFNYIMRDDCLELNTNIIIPYQDMQLEQYKSLLNIS